MSKRWMRGPLASNAGVGDSANNYVRASKDVNLFLYYFLTKILGFPVVDSGVGSTWTWEGHEHSGSDGVLTNSDLTFSSAAGLFTSGDVGKFLVLVDSTNEKNCGIYEIASYTSATEVTLKWYSTSGNYPIASTGITWYLIDGDTAGDPREGDYFVLSIPHTTSPATVRCFWLGGTHCAYHTGLGFEVCPEANAWDASSHTWKSTALDRFRSKKYSRGLYSSGHGRAFGYGDTDGSFFMVWDDHASGDAYKTGMGLSVLSAIEGDPVPSASELVFVWGADQTSGTPAKWTRTIENTLDSMAQGYIWSERGGEAVETWWLSWYKSGDIFRRDVGVNSRTGKRDSFPIWVQRDPSNEDDNFAPWGEMPSDHIRLATVHAFNEHVSFDNDDWLHIKDGVVIPWPGWPAA